MSGFVSEQSRSNDRDFATARDGARLNLQGRTLDNTSDGSGGDMTMSIKNATETVSETEISAGQKMLSAMSGSLLTSLLGLDTLL